jgi:putative hydrolase of the HAD superfamily
MSISAIAFDADDTLWHNESIFHLTQQRFAGLLDGWADPDALHAHLSEVERRNLRRYGYGVKGFTLSMIETAVELTHGRVPGTIIAQILAAGREMLDHPVDPLPGVEATLRTLQGRFRLLLITKGDLFHQEQKVAQSGLSGFFEAIEIVSEKDDHTYRRIFARHTDGAERAVMVGNSVRSDIVPALAAGAWAAHIPYHITWAHEVADPPVTHPRFVRLDKVEELPGWLADRAA